MPVHYTFGSPVNALNRADAFFFTLCDIPADEPLLKRIIKAWSYIKINALILDDINDLESDKREGEENSIIELGGDEAAMEKIRSMFNENIKPLTDINSKLAHYLESSIVRATQRMGLPKL